ncbi:unnamed protein product [Meloidogyne enterolobii]|uniref:Uncharacterized protein n=1 Tax=Meloidogyne enterolobii TaxID=390850 RepID=A0ACB1ALP1_MELEN
METTERGKGTLHALNRGNYKIFMGEQHKRQTTENAQKQGEKAEVIVPLNKCSPPRSPPKVKPPPTPKYTYI